MSDMKERLTKLIKESQERYIYAEEQVQYLIDNGVDCVNHGEWLWNRGCAYDEKQYYCSLCAGGSDTGRDKYCPNCGAKMKGGVQE